MSNTSIARSRLFFGQRNYEYETHTFNEETNEKIKISDETEEQWKQRILEELFSMSETYNYLALIFHDRDIINLETNEKKVLHCHFVLRFDNPRSYENILEITKCQKRNLERSTNQGSILRYLTHTTPEAMREQKTRYNVSEIYLKTNPSEDFVTGEDLERWYRSKIKSHLGRKEADTTVITSVANLAYQLSIGKIKPYQAREELMNEFGNEFGQSIYRKEKKKFQADYDDFLENKKRSILLNGKELSTVYIEGPSEVGKSVFAQDLANAINLANDRDILDTYLAAKNNKSSSTWDWISKYKDEYVTIFNDLDPYLFGFTDFLGTFETKVLVDISSRYRDKTWFSEYAIITKSTDIHEFINKICSGEINDFNKSEHQNIRYQVQRRLNLIIKIENDKVTLSQFNKKGVLRTKNTYQYENLDQFWNGEIRKAIIEECLELLNLC